MFFTCAINTKTHNKKALKIKLQDLTTSEYQSAPGGSTRRPAIHQQLVLLSLVFAHQHMADRWTADLILHHLHVTCAGREHVTEYIRKDTAESQTGSDERSPVGFHLVAPSRFPSTGGNWKVMETLAGKKKQG